MQFLYKDEKIVVCLKPVGVVSVDEPGGLPELVRAELGTDSMVYTVHRLDQVVGGVTVLARTRRACGDLGRESAERGMEKEYLAVVCGGPTEREGVLRDFLLRDTLSKRTAVVPEGMPGAQEAVLHYRTVISRDGLSLLRIRLHTGRTHQIRCQLSAHGMPICGDVKYGGDPTEPFPALWSCALAFSHPKTGERMYFFAPPQGGIWESFPERSEDVPCEPF